ncbi:MAG: LysR family transcriptional regulator [Rhodocyclaceae bacterium]
MDPHLDLKPHQLQYLVAVAEQGSLRQAAQVLGVSASAVSKGLKELEDVARVALFERQARGYVLSAAGRMLLVRSRMILAEMSTAMQELNDLQASAITLLPIGITPWIMHTILPAVLQRFSIIRPDVRLHIQEVLGTDYAALREGDIDMAIGLSPKPESSPEFVIRPLFSYEQAVACRVDHPCAHAKSLDSLAGQAWILSHTLEQYGSPFREFFQANFGEVQPGVRPATLHFTRAAMAALHIIENSDMLSILPWPLIEAMRSRYNIGAIPMRDKIMERQTSFVTRRNTACNGAIGQFVDVLMEVVNDATVRQDASWLPISRAVDLIRR